MVLEADDEVISFEHRAFGRRHVNSIAEES